jgi:hypothetical protein
MKTVRLLSLMLALAAASAVAAEPAASKPAGNENSPSTNTADTNACTWSSSIDDWRRLDDRTLIVWASRDNAYLVELSMPLFDLGSTESLAIEDHNHDGRVCGFGMDRVIIPHSGYPQSAIISSMKRLDEAGMQQLAQQYNFKVHKRADKTEPQKAG